MSIDLGALFGIAGGIAQQLLDTSGTKVTLRRTDDGRGSGTTDPVTLVHIDAEPALIGSALSAYWAPLGGGTVQGLTATEVVVGDAIVLLLPEVLDVQEQDELTIDECLDARLVGRVADVMTVLDSSAGALRVMHVRPRTQGPGAT